MTTPTQQTTAATATYVYGIAKAETEIDDDVLGVGDPPSMVSLVRHGDIAALVSQISPDKPIGSPEDLTAHARVLDGVASEAPVLPLRFGAVLADTDAVVSELLAQNHDGFLTALRQLDGMAEFVVKGRYREAVVLREVLDENEDARRLRAELAGTDETATRDQRIALGEMINNGVAAKRAGDTQRVVEALEKEGFTTGVREPSHELDAAHVACLAELDRQGDLERLVSKLADDWGDRVDVRILGPLAPYDFVITEQE